MKKLFLLLLTPFLTAGALTLEQRAALFTPADTNSVPLSVQIVSETQIGSALVTEMYFNGDTFNGNPTRVYAWYARPATGGPFPGVVQLHGAGIVDPITSAPAVFYATNGMACITLDWAGPTSTGGTARSVPYTEVVKAGQQAVSADSGASWQMVQPDQDGIAAGLRFVRRAVMFLESRSEVNRQQLFLSGMSAGAHMSLNVIGVEPKFAGAAVKYGCGYIRDISGYYGGYFGPISLCSQAQQDEWLSVFDPKVTIQNTAARVLMFSGTDDIFFKLPNVLMTYRNLPGDNRLLILPNDNHSQVGNEAIPLRYFRTIAGLQSGYAKLAAPSLQTAEGVTQLSVAGSQLGTVTRSVFYVKRAPSTSFNWGSGGGWTAYTAVNTAGTFTTSIRAPEMNETVVVYLYVEDATGAASSSDIVEVPYVEPVYDVIPTVCVTSAPMRVYSAPATCRQWSTVYSNTVPLKWTFPTGATKAKLTIWNLAGKKVAETQLAAVSAYTWTVFQGAVPADEDLFTLELAYDTGAAVTSRLAVVKGAFGGTPVANPQSTSWRKVDGNRIVAVDTAWNGKTTAYLNAQNRGVASAASVPDSGYWGLRLGDWKRGTLTLNLWDAQSADLLLLELGTFFILR